jgi:mercuric ion transport protein
MNDRTLLRTGVVGSVVTALCCLTPALVLVLGALGVSAWLGWLDRILLPALAVFLGLTGWAVYRLRREGRRGAPAQDR